MQEFQISRLAEEFPVLIPDKDGPLVQMGEPYVIYSLIIVPACPHIPNEPPAIVQHVSVSLLDDRDGKNRQPIMAGSLVSEINAKHFFTPEVVYELARCLVQHIEALRNPKVLRIRSEGNYLVIEEYVPEDQPQPLLN